MSTITINAGINTWYGSVTMDAADTRESMDAAVATLRALLAEAQSHPHPTAKHSTTGKPRTHSEKLDQACTKLLGIVKSCPEYTWSRISRIYKGTRMLTEARDHLLADGRLTSEPGMYFDASGRRLVGDFLRLVE